MTFHGMIIGPHRRELPHLRKRDGMWCASFEWGYRSYTWEASDGVAAWLGLAEDIRQCCMADRYAIPAWINAPRRYRRYTLV